MKRSTDEIIEAQEVSIKLSQDFLNSDTTKGLKEDIVMSSLLANGFSSGAYMGWFWCKDQTARGLKATISRLLFTSRDVRDNAKNASVFLIRKKYSGMKTEDKQLLSFAIVQGFERGANEYQTKQHTTFPIS